MARADAFGSAFDGTFALTFAVAITNEWESMGGEGGEIGGSEDSRDFGLNKRHEFGSREETEGVGYFSTTTRGKNAVDIGEVNLVREVIVGRH